MSRVIKFRYVARHTHEGSVRLFTHTLDLHSIEDTIDVIDLICSEIDPCTCCFNESQNHCDCDSILDHGEFEIISRDEFTGLLDKNGVDIYEGDIVYCVTRDPFGVPEQEAKFVVEFDYGSFLAMTASEEQEVIGNIHQNPELLKQ